MTTLKNGNSKVTLSKFDPSLANCQQFNLNDPIGYLPGEGLLSAIDISIRLGQPLLVSGDPGTGKSSVAGFIANQMQLIADDIYPTVLSFETNSTSKATDLFYNYNALGHFHASQNSKNPDEKIETRNFISYQVLGKAITLSNELATVKEWLSEKDRKTHGNTSKRAIVLIDEIDKAPRDFPNDILNQIELGYFRVPEIGPEAEIWMNSKFKPIIVITSNAEKNLPDAFLRRCIFYHIPFPKSEEMAKIIVSRIPKLSFENTFVREALHFIYELRRLEVVDRPPATAEILNWLLYLVLTESINTKNISLYNPNLDMKPTFSILSKSKDDLEKVVNFWKMQLDNHN
jgi:MoxR-like ATPase